MKINVNVAKGYVENARNRCHKCEEWSEWFDLMPIGKPITASEIVQLVANKHSECSWRTPSYQAVSVMLNAVKATGAVMRMEIAIEPYEIEVSWSKRPKKITIDKKTVFIRMV